MMIFDKARENADAIRGIGADAAERAKAAGVPVYYDDPALGGVVKEMPDGSKALVLAHDVEDRECRAGPGR